MRPLIITGSTRIVWTLPSLGVAIKFPKFYTDKRFLKDVGISFLRLDLKRMYSLFAIFSHLFFVGMKSNRSEYFFYLKNRKNIFLLPTHFSFCGIFNICPFAERVKEGEKKLLWFVLCDLTEDLVKKDTHHFENPDNFGYYKGKLRMLDYAGKKVQTIIKDRQHKLVQVSNRFLLC